MENEFRSFFKTVGGNEGNKCHYPTRLDTYGCGCEHDCKYCMDGDTLILMYDGSTKKLKDIEIGDEIYGVGSNDKYHYYTKSIVLNKWSVKKKSYKVTLANGVTLIASANHRFLTERGYKEVYQESNLNNCLTINDILTGPINNISINNKEINFNNSALKVVSIEPYKDEQELFDITTSTENFIANGVVSHNCYAKSLLDFRKLWDPLHPRDADINKIRRKIKSLPKDTPAIRLGGMTDCFQPIEKEKGITYETIKCLNENRIPYLIVTKSDLVADDKYLAILDKDLAHIQITVTTTNDELSKTYEKAVVPSRRIKAIEKLQENGFDVQLRLSPYIPEFVDLNILNNVKCDKILVEFLRVNTWIKKWFNIDYSDYTLKHGGYLQLPLEKKKELISKITGFKEITVCEDETEAYKYWRNNFNPNKNDCCNLRATPISPNPLVLEDKDEEDESKLW